MTSDCLEPGALIAGRYRVERLLGEGAYGHVHAATDIELGRPVAVKVLRAETVWRAHVGDRFAREARVLARLRHPNAVAVLDYGDHDGRPFLVMDFVSGPTLASLLDTMRPLPLARAARIGAELADVLAAAHAIPLVHRDVKPENVILEPTHDGGERALLIDFGLAFLVGDDDKLGRLTRKGLIAGTPHYMAPEQVRDLDIGPPADVYSLGCLIYELVTGQAPFDAPTAVELMSQHLYVAPTPARTLRPDLDVWLSLDQLLLEMLAKSPALRPPAEEVRARLVQAAAAGAAQSPRRLAREGRMVPPAPPARVDEGSAWGAVVAYVGGEPPPSLLAALAANGVSLVSDAGAAAAILAPDCDPPRIAALAAGGVPVVSAAARRDMPRIVALLRAGAAEVADLPLEPADVTAKVSRAIRRQARAAARGAR